MPLVQIFTHAALKKAVPLRALQQRLCDIWSVQPDTTKMLRLEVKDWTSEFNEGENAI
jgi:hypothetical protein